MGSEFSSQSGTNYKLTERIDVPAGLSPSSCQWALYKAVSCTDRSDVSVFVYSPASDDKQEFEQMDCLKCAENCAKVCILGFYEGNEFCDKFEGCRQSGIFIERCFTKQSRSGTEFCFNARRHSCCPDADVVILRTFVTAVEMLLLQIDRHMLKA